MIQIDMAMPKNCIDCPACNEYLMCAIPCIGRGWGENDVKEFSQSRPEWCPMTEQPQIVRCKDCKNWLPMDRFHQDFHPGKGGCEINCLVSDADWFCADAERKSE